MASEISVQLQYASGVIRPEASLEVPVNQLINNLSDQLLSDTYNAYANQNK